MSTWDRPEVQALGEERLKLLREAAEKAKEKAEKEQGVQFIYPNQEPFVEACMPLHTSVLENNPDIRPMYDAIQAYNELYPSVAE